MENKVLRKIYIDTNVLINYCTGQVCDVEAMDYVFRTRRKEVLFTSSLALVQTIANLQTKKKARAAFTKKQTEEAINKLISKITVIDMSADDVVNGMTMEGTDIEDNVHFALLTKLKCDIILTNNISDFSRFKSIRRISPQMGLSLIKTKIK